MCRRSTGPERNGSRSPSRNRLCTSHFVCVPHYRAPSNSSVSSWYNVPPEKVSKGKSKAHPSKTNGTAVEVETNGTAEATDSSPLNFDTFVPTHDPSLAAAAAVMTGAGPSLSVSTMDATTLGNGGEAAMVSQDEAFSRAMTAMYWSGYWTAVYHVCFSVVSWRVLNSTNYSLLVPPQRVCSFSRW